MLEGTLRSAARRAPRSRHTRRSCVCSGAEMHRGAPPQATSQHNRRIPRRIICEELLRTGLRLLRALWQNPLHNRHLSRGVMQGLPPYDRGTGRRASRTNATTVVDQTVLSVTIRWCVGQQFYGRDAEARPSPAVPTLFPPGTPQNLANQSLPPQHLPTRPHENSRR